MENVPAAPAAHPPRDWPTVIGVAVVAAAAVIASFTAQAGLAHLAGWHAYLDLGVRVHLSWLLPLCVDAYGAVATRIAVNERYSAETRRHALGHAIAAVVSGVIGNAVYHSIEAGVLVLGGYRWAVVVTVSVIPPLALGALAHLMALCGRDDAAARALQQDTASELLPEPPPGPAREDDQEDDQEDTEPAQEPFGVQGLVPAPGAPAPGPIPVPVYQRALEVFAPEGAIEELPSLRTIKKQLGCGQPRAQQVREYLSALAAG